MKKTVETERDRTRLLLDSAIAGWNAVLESMLLRADRWILRRLAKVSPEKARRPRRRGAHA